jgi:hypothetical protein
VPALVHWGLLPQPLPVSLYSMLVLTFGTRDGGKTFPRINRKLTQDNMTSYPAVAFMDKFSSHPQISVHPKLRLILPYILESNLHLVFAAFLNKKKLLHWLYHFSKIQL